MNNSLFVIFLGFKSDFSFNQVLYKICLASGSSSVALILDVIMDAISIGVNMSLLVVLILANLAFLSCLCPFKIDVMLPKVDWSIR